MDMVGGWQLWVAAGVALCALEIKLPGFVVFWLGIGALVAAVPAAFGLPVWVQLAAFSGTSLGLFAASRTIFKRYLVRNAPRVRHGVEAMIGAEAQVVDEVPDGGEGVVRINGELWSARSLAGPVPSGERVVVERVEGLKVYVRRPAMGLTAVKGRS